MPTQHVYSFDQLENKIYFSSYQSKMQKRIVLKNTCLLCDAVVLTDPIFF